VNVLLPVSSLRNLAVRLLRSSASAADYAAGGTVLECYSCVNAGASLPVCFITLDKRIIEDY
jgi:hypothetical protein